MDSIRYWIAFHGGIIVGCCFAAALWFGYLLIKDFIDRLEDSKK